MTDVQYVACIFHVVFLFIDDGCILHVYQMQLGADYKSVFPMLVSPNLYGDFFFGSEIVFYIAGRGLNVTFHYVCGFPIFMYT